ncbi:2-amino-4-hydroxy-6-hydroxymethyldihydropteridine diphosphokinase [Pontivivens insulae]|uniref:2-amino-4-hydroxy-6-hydroxymethyldihydropteridine pyrophosphokinase n=1 Tax=Pontivivens insulae TaxID=1639689 RepID=A0A2R8ADD8_9RHOB|nr:2-amino-4-hydroxy-6-hydroxymethyldihydropteridine diphosphokinase [Pontivivens insulae]RED14181.1 2-amino-4-hydroxy-6-hydroxymethyldihydropteridine diphosphokinase [Pontivivens insulae]SPF30256.1 2-amino-4-hydroxy-6-hydroxymethyldihydropteridinepyrophosphokinase [Pontivivens insulae]
MHYLIALGANLAGSPLERAAVLDAALAALSCDHVRVEAVSAYYTTPAFPPGSGPDFVNAAACLISSDTPQAMLTRLHEVEAGAGRTRDVRWGPRTLDLDLLGAGQQILPDISTVRAWMAQRYDGAPPPPPEELILPHPRLHERGFVLVPLADIAPDWTHPVTERTVSQMLADLAPAERAEIIQLAR